MTQELAKKRIFAENHLFFGLKSSGEHQNVKGPNFLDFHLFVMK